MNKYLFFTLAFLIMLGTVFPIPKINVAHADLQGLINIKAALERDLSAIDRQLNAYNANTASPAERQRIKALAEKADRIANSITDYTNQIAELQQKQDQEQRRAEEQAKQEQRRAEEQAKQEQYEEAAKPCGENDPTSGVCFDNPITGRQEGLTPLIIWGRLIRFILSIVGSVALLFFVIGGFKYMTAHGNEELIKEGKATLVWATLGLAVVFGSYLLLSNIITVLLQAFGIA